MNIHILGHGLNSSFLNAAFTTTEQNKIAVTTVDNSKGDND